MERKDYDIQLFVIILLLAAILYALTDIARVVRAHG